jgi:SprB repeat
MATTPTPTPTPSTAPIICGSGVTTGIYYYTDCCGNFVQGTNTNLIINMDYTKPNNGITKLNVIATTTCPTPTQTPTPTNTPTLTQTPTNTPTLTQTPTTTITQSPTPSNAAAYKLKNNCDVFTLFDMGVRCQVLKQPSSQTSFDGILTIRVTGGTAPYSFYWTGGQRTQTLTNIPAGNYPITIVDYYGDYTANTICSIFVPSPTPTTTNTPTPTLTPSPSWPNLCLIVTYATVSYGPYQFVISGSQNGKPQWTSGSMILGWSITNLRWEIQGWTNTIGLPVSTDPSNIPTSSWSIAGGNGTQPSISMTQGTCPTYLPLSTNVVGTNTSCSGTLNCNGSISVTTMGGVPPYIYSINNGNSFQSSNVFNGLCQNTYTVITKDSLNNTQIQVVIIGFDSAPTTYSITTVVDRIEVIDVSTQIAYWYVDVYPPITNESIVSFDLNVSISKNYNQPGSGLIIDTITVVQNEILQYPSSTSSVTTTSNRPYCSPYETVNVSNTKVYPLQFSKNIVVSGTSTSILQITDGQVAPNGCVTKLDQTILTSVSTSVIDGCTCCIITDDDIPQGIQNHSLQYGQNNNLPSAYTAVISGVGNSQSEACADYGNNITRYINGPSFQTGLTLLGGNPLHPNPLIGYTYCTDGSGQVYELYNGIIGNSSGIIC